jgi:ADP-heptose:LPS heptosyltransferase
MAKAKVRTRVGTARRLYHYLYCNYWVNVKRNGSNLHETELDMMLLRPFTRKNYYSKEEIIELRHFKLQKIEETIKPFLKDGKFNLIIHPKTRGEHIEWALSNYAELIKELPKEKFNILITGSQKEGQKIYQELIEPVKEKVTDLTGKTTLKELINLISHSDGLIAGSTGPIHIAAAFNINTLGLYAPIKPFHATRWGPVGKHAKSLSIKKDCHACRDGSRCLCVNQIKISSVKSAVLAWQKNKEKSLGESVDK